MSLMHEAQQKQLLKNLLELPTFLLLFVLSYLFFIWFLSSFDHLLLS